MKTKYPVPITEELLDELTHVKWFSCLDLTAGYHQIHVQTGETYKTAFQTHSGHYEICVMAFGLSGTSALISVLISVASLAQVHFGVFR